jgi:dCTP diphosphatase
VRIESLHALQ